MEFQYYLIGDILIYIGSRNKYSTCNLKDKVEFWSCDCIVKEKVWNGSEKVDHIACKY